MYRISYKYKQFWFLLIKLSIVFGAGYFIYTRVFYNAQLPLKALVTQLNTYVIKELWVVSVLLFLTLLNWILEIFKWQNLVNTSLEISFLTAAKQSLSSHTLSIITPFKSGEYMGKSFYFPKKEAKKILLLNLIGNLTQLLVTIVFGSIGLFFFITHFDITISPHRLRRLAYFIAMGIAFLFVGKQAFSYKRGYRYQKMFAFLKKISLQIRLEVLFLSLLRYFVFSYQFYFLLLAFEVEVPYTTAMFLIFTLYFIASVLPVMSLFDFVIKGSVAIYLFAFIGADELKILSISMLMWGLNFVLPALIGSYYVFVFSTEKKSKRTLKKAY